MTQLPLSPALTLVYLEQGMLLSKQQFADWRAVQDRFPDYQASLAPEAPAHLVEYLADEYPEMTEETGKPWAAVLGAFLASADEDLPLSSAGNWVCTC